MRYLWAMLAVCTVTACSGVESKDSEVATGEVVRPQVNTLELGVVDDVSIKQSDLPLTTPDGGTICSFSDFDNHGYMARRFEIFNFAEIGQKLSKDSALRDRIGFASVSDCGGARKYVSSLLSYELEHESEDQARAATDLGSEPVEKIHSGETVTQTTGRSPQGGIVELSSLGCTGSFITGQHILTAAHCVTGNGTITLSYRAPTLANGAMQSEKFKVARNSSYQDGNRSDDHAVLTRVAGDLAWAVGGNRFRWYTDATKTGIGLGVFGYGAQYYDGGGAMTGTLRTGQGFADINVQSQTAGYFQAQAHSAQICKGDSGGPALRQLTSTGTNDEFAIIWGTANSAEFQGSKQCPVTGANMYWTKTTTDQAFIEGALGFTCSRWSNSDGSYARCW